MLKMPVLHGTPLARHHGGGASPAIRVLQAAPWSSLSPGSCRDRDEDEDGAWRMRFVLNCQPSSPVWGLAEGGTEALSPHLSIAPCCGTNKEESSRRNLQKPDETEICNYLSGEEGEGEWEEIGRRAGMGTRGAALLHGVTSPSPRASCPGAGGATPKPSPKDGCFGGDDVEKRDRSLVGSAGPRRGHASSVRAEVAVAMDLPCQATLGAAIPSTLGITMVMRQRFSSI